MPPIGIVVLAGPDSPNGDARGGGHIPALEVVANRAIADHVLDALADAGIDQVVLVVPATLRARVQKSVGVQVNRFKGGIRYLEQPGRTDFSSTLKLVAPVVGRQSCVVHPGDGLLAEPLTPVFRDQPDGGSDLTLLVYQGAVNEDHLNPATQRLLHIAELHERQAALGLAGLCIFGEGALAAVNTAHARVDGVVDLTSVAEQIATAGGKLGVKLVEGWRRYGGDPADLLELNRIALDRLDSALAQSHHNGNRIEGRVMIDDTASVRSSVIIGPTVIGPHAQIADAYIGPYTSVGAGVRIEGSEIERSIISEGASVMHVGGRLVASVVGREARIFRDFSLPRALRLRVGDGNEVSLC